MMSWFHTNTPAADASNHASPAEIVSCFQEHRNLLGKLVVLITGDRTTADQAIVKACEITLQGNSPFRNWLLEWAKAVTITSAISQHAEAICCCEATYKDRLCGHAEHSWQEDPEERAAILDLIVQADAQDLIVALDPLCRAILVLKVAIRSSIQDCVFRLNVSPAAVLAASCHAMTWLDHCRVKLLDEHKVSHAL